MCLFYGWLPWANRHGVVCYFVLKGVAGCWIGRTLIYMHAVYIGKGLYQPYQPLYICRQIPDNGCWNMFYWHLDQVPKMVGIQNAIQCFHSCWSSERCLMLLNSAHFLKWELSSLWDMTYILWVKCFPEVLLVTKCLVGFKCFSAFFMHDT